MGIESLILRCAQTAVIIFLYYNILLQIIANSLEEFIDSNVLRNVWGCKTEIKNVEHTEVVTHSKIAIYLIYFYLL